MELMDEGSFEDYITRDLKLTEVEVSEGSKTTNTGTHPLRCLYDNCQVVVDLT